MFRDNLLVNGRIFERLVAERNGTIGSANCALLPVKTFLPFSVLNTFRTGYFGGDKIWYVDALFVCWIGGVG